MQTVTSAQMKEIEHRANANGLSYSQMMYHAGAKAAENILQHIKNPVGKIAIVLTGRGNNGGDGYVVAQKLNEAGLLVLIIMAEGTPKTQDAQTYFGHCKDSGIEILAYHPAKANILFMGADIIVDAIYGTGFHGKLNDTVRSIARMANNSDAKIYALDLPSGLNADTAEADFDVIRADTTIAFHLLKPAHIDPNTKSLCGDVHCVDIGIPHEFDQ